MQKPIKISVFLDPELQRAAKLAAIQAGKSLSALVAEMIEKKYGKKIAAKG